MKIRGIGLLELLAVLVVIGAMAALLLSAVATDAGNSSRLPQVEFKSVALTSEVFSGKAPVKLQTEQALFKGEATMFRVVFSEWPAECNSKYAMFRLRKQGNNGLVTVQSSSSEVGEVNGKRSLRVKMNPVMVDGPLTVDLGVGPVMVGSGEIRVKAR